MFDSFVKIYDSRMVRLVKWRKLTAPMHNDRREVICWEFEVTLAAGNGQRYLA